MNQETVKYNLRLAEKANSLLQEAHKSVVRIEASYINWKGDEAFVVRVAYDNYPNSEFCMSYDNIFVIKDDYALTIYDVETILSKALEINERETARRIEAHKRVTR